MLIYNFATAGETMSVCRRCCCCSFTSDSETTTTSASSASVARRLRSSHARKLSPHEQQYEGNKSVKVLLDITEGGHDSD